MATDKIMYDCFMCRRSFQMGPGRYDGKPIKAWDIIVCLRCIEINHDGIVPTTYPQLLDHLSKRGIPIVENTKGWIDWPAPA